jgi:adenylate cyclase
LRITPPEGRLSWQKKVQILAQPAEGRVAQQASKKIEADGPTHDEIGEHLRALLACDQFDASARNKRFFSYVVEETLAGRGKLLKAYNIALAVFGRDENFDPLIDPIVRIEAGRLRHSLDRYYVTAGANDSLRIDIPKGSYAVSFTRTNNKPPQDNGDLACEDIHVFPAELPLPRGAGSADALRMFALAAAVLILAAGAWLSIYWSLESSTIVRSSSLREPKILVQPFQDMSGHPNRAFLARALTTEIIVKLTQNEDLFVYGPDVGRGHGPGPKIDYVLAGSVNPTNTNLWVSVTLLDSNSGQFIWTWSKESNLTPTTLLDVETRVVDRIVRSIIERVHPGTTRVPPLAN